MKKIIILLITVIALVSCEKGDLGEKPPTSQSATFYIRVEKVEGSSTTYSDTLVVKL